MLEVIELEAMLNKIAPEEMQESWDNSGMQINTGKEYANKILVCLEITRAVIEEAVEKGADFIVSHHPLYFNPLKKIEAGEHISDYTISLIKNDISVYSSHTSFDKVYGGNNTMLCSLLDIKNIMELREGDGEYDFIGYYGELDDEIRLIDFANRLKKVLKTEDGEIRITGNPEKKVKRIGVCTGAGADLAELAREAGCDLFVTGDIKYHEAQNAKEDGMALIDAGHFGTEYIFAYNMAEKLRALTGDRAEVISSGVNINPFLCI